MASHFRRARGHRGRVFVNLMASLLLLATVAAATNTHAATSRALVPLSGHVLDALTRATPVSRAKEASAADQLTITVTLRRTDEAGFQRYLADVQDPSSGSFRNFLSSSDLTLRFGPSQQAYDAVLAWLTAEGLELVQGSDNRLTLSVRGSRARAEQAFGVRIGDYKSGKQAFYANDRDPSVPADVAAYVQAISGLSNAGIPTAPLGMATPQELEFCEYVGDAESAIAGELVALSFFPGTYTWGSLSLSFLLDALWLQRIAVAMSAFAVAAPAVGAPALGLGGLISTVNLYCFSLQWGLNTNFPFPLGHLGKAGSRTSAVGANHQKIGFVEFDTFHKSDIADWLNLGHGDSNFLNQIGSVAVNGGVSSPGKGESEVLLDIVTALITDPSPNSSYVLYEAPANTTFQQVFNAMINDGVTVISNSWSECEDQHTVADVQAIDSVLAQAVASGISVVNGSGDSGATCLDGSPNTIGVPADSPHATAVGGTSPKFGPGYTYAGETWWNGSGQVPPSGQGGFGNSRYFARPSYQNGFTSSSTRSVPDMAVPADPRAGLGLCQADAGGCPTGLLYGGTSMAAPALAGMIALLNEQVGSNMGEINPALYPLAGTRAFHSPASMGSDFAHVGLGSPHQNYLRLALTHQTIGPVSASASWIVGSGSAPADGATKAFVQVNLLDANGYPVSGKNVALTPSAGSSAVISGPSGSSDVNNGAVVFTITDTKIENVTFTASDTSDGVVLARTASIAFGAPPAKSGGIVAAPTPVAADGTSTTTITVTLQDVNGHGAIGKTVTLSQGAGNSIITGPVPAITDANGQIQFTATDTVAESVTYTAVDVTDGNLAVPGSAVVTFTGGSASCLPAPPTAASGFTLTPFATGFLAQNFFFANINFVGCPGVTNPAFDPSGSMFVADFPSGDLYKMGPSGGTASTANKLSNLGKTFGNVVFGRDGNLYGTTFSPAAVVQVDASTGAIVRTVASGFSCPSGLTVDPLSGDLFFDDNCVGGIQNASIWRVQNPSSANPTVVVYATLPGFGNGSLAFAPDGTLYAVCCAFNNAAAPVLQISGTNQPPPHTPIPLAGITADMGGLAIGEVLPSGAAKSLIVNTGGAAGGAGGALKLIQLATQSSTVLANGLVEPGVIGPDGCMYVNSHNTILRLAPTTGGCSFAPTNPSPVLTLSAASTTPAQGTTQALTAKFANIAVPAGTPVVFEIAGANTQVKLGDTDAGGTASASLTGNFTGIDVVVATATVGATTLTSAPVRITWSAGRHATYTTLNLSPSGGVAGTTVTVIASLSDRSVNPAVPIAGASIVLALGAQNCTAITDASGNARCSLTVPGRPASGPPLALSASFAGNSQYASSTDAEAFQIVGAAVAGVPGAPTIGTATGGAGVAFVTFSAPASDGGSPITSFVATCTPVGGGSATSSSGSGSPILVAGLAPGVTYTCTVSAMNAAGTGAASAPSNPVQVASGPVTIQAIPTLEASMLALLACALAVIGMAAMLSRR